ncbi:MAG TPA: P1 family peptidase, partial [Burkholderiaceae bacterium]|nr:P1 family peptidase [Burkholderiaceae bacterium]
MRLHTTLVGIVPLAIASTAFAQTLPQTPGLKNAITDVPGIEVGHYTASSGTGGMTGTTAIIARGGATAGVTQRGGAPGTRETDILKSEKALGTAH